MRLLTLEECNNNVNTKADIPIEIQEQLRIGNYRYIIDSCANIDLQAT